MLIYFCSMVPKTIPHVIKRGNYAGNNVTAIHALNPCQ